jgi:hypothetical protein
MPRKKTATEKVPKTHIAQKPLTVHVEIEGVTALLQHRFSEGSEEPGPNRPVNEDRGTPREQAEGVCYRDNEGKLYHPSSAIARLLREAGANHKQRSNRKSLKWIVPAGVRMAEDTIPLFVNGRRAIDFEVDSRPVVIPATKGRIMRHRPRLDVWKAKFDLKINPKVLDEDTVYMLLCEGAEQIGIGDYRPEKGGPFGVFHIVKWELLKK